MKFFILQNKYLLCSILAVLCLILGATPIDASISNGTIDSNNKYAWSENAGWVDFGTSQGDVHVTDTELTGYAWSETAGWISLNCSNNSSCSTVSYSIINNTRGTLSGHAWSENAGWINFAPTGGGVSIDPNGDFGGYAWGENIGWIVFNCDTTSTCATVSYKITTDWRPVNARQTTTPSRQIPGAAAPLGPPGTTVILPGTPAPKPIIAPPVNPPSDQQPSAPPVLARQTLHPNRTRLYKLRSGAVVYVLLNGTLRPFVNRDVFEATGLDWKTIRTVSTLPSAPLGTPYDYADLPLRNGSLVQMEGDLTVFLISDGKRRPFKSQAVFDALGYQMSNVHTLTKSEKIQFTESTLTIFDTTKHPNGTLVKYTGDVSVYLLEGGKKRLIKSQKAFRSRAFRFREVVTISSTEKYRDGTTIGS